MKEKNESPNGQECINAEVISASVEQIEDVIDQIPTPEQDNELMLWEMLNAKSITIFEFENLKDVLNIEGINQVKFKELLIDLFNFKKSTTA